MIYWQQGSETTELSTADLHNALSSVYDKLGQKSRVMAIPPDFSRYHSGTGPLLQHTYKYYGSLLQAILPALGTHAPMTDQEIKTMFGSIPRHLFYEHRFRQDIKTLGTVPGSFVKEVSEGKVDFSWPAQVNKMLVDDNFDLIISLGQVVPHEVVGMANYNKNIFVGTGGVEGINKSHFLGAAYGMERMMGRADTPVRRVLEYASREFAADLPILYILTVMGQNEAGNNVMRGLFIGDDYRCFNAAAELSLKVNFTLLEKPLSKIVTYLDPREFKSTWLGNKAIYRTRMALADQGELIILAPGVKEFGEDKEIDRLIRKYGYVGTDRTLELVRQEEDLQANLSAAAHMIHGSSDERFTITYCPGNLTRTETESVNFKYGDLKEVMQKYNPGQLQYGFNQTAGNENIYFIPNPAAGLWSSRERFKN